MKVKALLFTLCCAWLSGVTSFQVHSATIFTDSFESADLSATNAEGFKWTDNAWTSVISSTEEVYGVTNTPRTKANAASFPGKDWTPHDGNYSLRFRYSAGAFMSEQRFDLGTPRKELWIRYWIRVPVNFKYGPVSDPNKFFAIWMDGYSQSGDGSTIWLSMWRKNITDAQLGFTYSLGGKTSSVSFKQYIPFFTVADAGKWMQVVLHFKAESSLGTSNGIIQTFRRWDGESKFIKLHDTVSAPIKIPIGGPDGFKAGYILGWANAAYEANTEWLVDDFVIFDSSPLTGLLGQSPKPPGNLIVQ